MQRTANAQRIITGILSIVAMTGFGAAHAQTLDATSAAQTTTNVKPYGIASFRHYNIVTKDDVAPKLHFRPTLGLKLLDERFDLSATAYLEKKPETTAITQAAPTAKLALKPLVLGLATIEPYAEYTFQYEATAANTRLASYQSVAKSGETLIGKLTFAAGVELATILAAKPEKTRYSRDSGVSQERFALLAQPNDKGEYQGHKTKPDFYHEWDIGLTLNPSFLPKLGVGLMTVFNATYQEHVAVTETGRDSRYGLQTSTYERLKLSYPVTDTLKFINELYAHQDGAYARGAASTRLQNVGQLEYTIY